MMGKTQAAGRSKCGSKSCIEKMVMGGVEVSRGEE